MKKWTLAQWALLVCTLIGASGVLADDATILVVSGKIASPGRRVFSFAELDRLPHVRFRESSLWEGVAHRVDGVRMRDVLKAAGVAPDATEVVTESLDRYSVAIPLTELAQWDVVLCLKLDGKRLSAQTKGPLRVIYPVDATRNTANPVPVEGAKIKAAYLLTGLVVH